MNEEIKNLSKYSKNNKTYIENSDKCACYFCLNTFSPQEIEEWTDNGQTAICPKCKVDSVVGDSTTNLDKQFIEKASKYWFY